VSIQKGVIIQLEAVSIQKIPHLRILLHKSKKEAVSIIGDSLFLVKTYAEK
jgi:hypothetical protein